MIHNGKLFTPRLELRPFEAVDESCLVEIFADPDVHRYVGDGKPLPLELARLWIVRSRENLARHGYGTGAVIERQSGRMIGWAGFSRPPDDVEQIIYGLAATHWHHGLGREIVGALVNFAVERAMERMYATINPANAASLAILRRADFVRVARGYRGHDDCDLYARDFGVAPNCPST